MDLLKRLQFTLPPAIWAFLSFPVETCAQLVWPEDEVAQTWIVWQATQRGGARSDRFSYGAVWPKTLKDLCGDTFATHDNKSTSEKALAQACAEAQARAQSFWHATFNLASHTLNRPYPLGVPFEDFDGSGGWMSYRVAPEVGLAWERVPPLARFELEYSFTENLHALFRFDAQRDLAAWHGDALGLNTPLSEKEMNLNEPDLGYVYWESHFFGVKAGRLPVHWSPSAEYGLTLSSAVPYHDGILLSLKGPAVKFHFLYSSLNPWLEGTPDTLHGMPPVGSEAYRQTHYDIARDPNAHKRVYGQGVKTLLAHRLEAALGPMQLGITETNIIGGKSAQFRNLNPLVFFHNNFQYGYSNVNLSLDARLSLPKGVSLFGEVFLDDIYFPFTEQEGNSTTLYGVLAGAEWIHTLGNIGLRHGFHAIRTHPFVYNAKKPLNTFYARHVVHSNFQQDGDAHFVDQYVVDYPMGYFRGADALDLWYRCDWSLPPRLLGMAKAGFLAQGDKDGNTLFEESYNTEDGSPSGVAERELRLELEMGYRVRRNVEISMGMGLQAIRNLRHVRGEKVTRGQVFGGIKIDFPEVPVQGEIN